MPELEACHQGKKDPKTDVDTLEYPPDSIHDSKIFSISSFPFFPRRFGAYDLRNGTSNVPASPVAIRWNWSIFLSRPHIDVFSF